MNFIFYVILNFMIFTQIFQKTAFFAGAIFLSASVFSGTFASENSEISEKREYTQSVSSSCSPVFFNITPEKYSDIGEIETLKFSVKNNVNPDSVSVRINTSELDFLLDSAPVSYTENQEFSGTIDVKNAPNGRQIVSLYAESNDAIHCSFREYIYVLYKNSENIHVPDNQYSTPEISRKNPEISLPVFSDDIVITFPVLDSQIFTIHDNTQKISGTSPKGAKKIWVDFSDEHGNTEHYFLRKFTSGNSTFEYFASTQYNNLSYGLNSYTIYAELENGEFSESETIILFYPEENYTKPFVDTIGHWAEDSITFLRSKGIVHGRNLTKNQELFFPNSTITKAESLKIATLSFNVKKQKFEENTKDSFLDVNASDWFADYASTAKKAKLTMTEGKNLFPHANVTERDAVNLIHDASLVKMISAIGENRLKITRAEFSDEVVKLMR